jgi:hypothetical protein
MTGLTPDLQCSAGSPTVGGTQATQMRLMTVHHEATFTAYNSSINILNSVPRHEDRNNATSGDGQHTP